MKAAKLVGVKKHEIIEVVRPTVGEEEVLVEVHVCGMCASEIADWRSGEYTSNNFMGHEVVGIVEEIGDRVKNVKVGDRVTGLILNGFAEFAKAHFSLVTKVPENLTDKEAIGEPIGCLVSGARRTEVEYGNKVAIIGMGYMGIGFMQLLKIKGAGEVTAIDITENALVNAKKFGADCTYLAKDVTDDMKVIEYGINMDGGFDIVAEVSGSQPGITLAGEITGVHKTMSIVGFHQNGTRNIDLELWNWKAFSVINAHERRDDEMMKSIEQGLKLISLGKLNTKDMITHEFKLEEIDKAFETMVNKPEGYLKAVIKITD